jgi:hypothetical protein
MITGRPRLATGGGTVAAGRPNPELSSLVDTDVYVYYGNAGAAEPNDADTWNADYGVVYHLKEDPAGTAPRPRTARNNAVHGTYDISGAIVQDNTLWGGKCILFDSGPRLRVERASSSPPQRSWLAILLLLGSCRGERTRVAHVVPGGRDPACTGPRL